MKKVIILAVALTLFCTFTFYSYAFYCGKDGRYLATEGRHKYQILKDCGPPVVKEDVGVAKKGGTYSIIEEWYYIIDKDGHKNMYRLKFDEKGILVEIDSLGEKK
jgi:hypothetical protein